MMRPDVADEVERRLGERVASVRAVGGGDVAESSCVTLESGTVVFAKTHQHAPEGFFTTEAVGLSWLAEAGAVAIPEVLAVADDPPLLVLEWIETGARHHETEQDFGRALAALHASGAPCFGRVDRRTTGSRGLPNEPANEWTSFYAANRLLPLARLAADVSALPASTITGLEQVAGRLDELGGPPEPPARLHGDLWAGNRLIGVGGVSWLIDPAAHGGHREFDLAMMRLFGGFGRDCFAAYGELTPLADGWEARVPLHQLAPLVVHAIKFGGGYVDATQDAVASLM